MTTPHPHSEFLHAIADGRCDEFECHHESWGADVWRRSPGCAGGVCISPEAWTVRRKPRTIRIGELEVPEPMRVAPDKGAEFWLADILEDGTYLSRWTNCLADARWLKSGICHLKREDAELHRKALILVSGGTP